MALIILLYQPQLCYRSDLCVMYILIATLLAGTCQRFVFSNFSFLIGAFDLRSLKSVVFITLMFPSQLQMPPIAMYSRKEYCGTKGGFCFIYVLSDFQPPRGVGTLNSYDKFSVGLLFFLFFQSPSKVLLHFSRRMAVTLFFLLFLQ